MSARIPNRLSLSGGGFTPASGTNTCCLDGDHDWMDPAGGTQSVQNLRKVGNTQGRMYIVPHAGHHGMSYPSMTYRLVPISSRPHNHSLLR